MGTIERWILEGETENKSKKVKDACEVEERRSRVDSISHILEGVKYKTESAKASRICVSLNQQ